MLRQQPQPWMSYRSEDMRTGKGLVSDVLLPFQIVSEGDFISAEIRGSGGWQPVVLPVTSVEINGEYYISYLGGDIVECGAYDFRILAGEIWWFERIIIEEFIIEDTGLSIKDDFMLPMRFLERSFEGIPLIAPCDSILPFQFSTENQTAGEVTVRLVDCEYNYVAELDIEIGIGTIDGKTYYIHEGGCFYPFLECGIYRLEIIDGEHSYFSPWFDVICDVEEIPEGSRVELDIDGRVIRDEGGSVCFRSCIGGLEIENITIGDVSPNQVLIYFNTDIDVYSMPPEGDFEVRFSGINEPVTAVTMFPGNILALFVGRIVSSNETGWVTYRKGAYPIRTNDGKPIGSFYRRNIKNNI